MKTTVVVIGLAAGLMMAAGCGSDGEADDDGLSFPIDAGGAGNPDADLAAEPCNPISQTGCVAGEKCAFILDVEEPERIGHTGCVPDGTAQLGEACEPPEIDGADTCAAGGHCYIGACQEICTTVSPMCAEGSSCVSFSGFDFQWCLPNCDPIAQDCGPTAAGNPQGCYLGGTGASCVSVFGDGVAPGGACEFLNQCAPGGGCFGDPGGCLRYCSLDVCPPDVDEMGMVTAWCGGGAVNELCTNGNCAGGDPFTGQECRATEACQGIQGEDIVGVCADLSGP